MFIVLCVKECDAEVVEVEADLRRKLAEPVAMAMQVVEQEHRVLSEVVKGFVGGFVEETHSHLSFRPLAQDGSSPAAAQQIAFLPPGIAGKHDDVRLQMVSEPQQEVQPFAPTHAHRQGQPAVELPVGIEGVPFVDDICDEVEGERTVHAIAATVAETLHPDEGIGQFFHVASTKLALFLQTSNSEPQIIHDYPPIILNLKCKPYIIQCSRECESFFYELNRKFFVSSWRCRRNCVTLPHEKKKNTFNQTIKNKTMKKIFAFAAIAAAMSLTACSGSTGKGTAEEDSLAVENIIEEGAEPAAVVSAVAEKVQAGDATAAQDAVEALQEELKEIVESGDAEKAAAYASQVKAFVEENAQKLGELNISTLTLNDLINAAKALPTTAAETAEAAADAVKADAEAAKDAAVEAAQAQAQAAAEEAQAKANAAAEEAKAKANAAVEDAANKANDAINKAAGKLKL